MFINCGYSLFIFLNILAHKILNLYTLIFTIPALPNKPSKDIE